jgi:hypothetical protein
MEILVALSFVALLGLAIFMREVHDRRSKIKHKKPKKPWMGALEAYNLALNRIARNPLPAVLFVAAYVTIMANPFGLAIPLALVFGLLFIYALPLYGLAAANSYKLSLKEFLRPDFRIGGVLILLQILLVLILVGSVLMFLLPIIWTLAWFFFALFVAVDTGMKPIASLKESMRIAERHIGKVWGIIGFDIILNTSVNALAGISPGGAMNLLLVGTAAFISVWYIVASAILYRYLRGEA